MKFADLLAVVGNEPLFETGLLLAGEVDPLDVRRQLSRWVQMGRLIQLRRGLYMLAKPYRRVDPHPFVVAGRLVRGSYVSCESALEHHTLIPEHVPLVTSVTSQRPATLSTPVGEFQFRHVKPALFWGCEEAQLGGGQVAFVAKPAKAVLDLLYLTPRSDSPAYLRELRLQPEEHLDVADLRALADRTGSPKLRRAVAALATLLDDERAARMAL
jgi:predicted transcriptional regulator of viral defense system